MGMRLRCGWCHARKRWGRNFGDFEKKELIEILTLGEGRLAGGYGMRPAFFGSDGAVSIVKIVSLSPRVEKLNSRS